MGHERQAERRHDCRILDAGCLREDRVVHMRGLEGMQSNVSIHNVHSSVVVPVNNRDAMESGACALKPGKRDRVSQPRLVPQ